LLISTFEEVKTQEVDIVGEFLNLDHVCKRDPVGLTLRQLFFPVEVAGRIVLLMQLPLIEVVVLEEDFTYRQI
jgi:hypothetical protein